MNEPINPYAPPQELEAEHRDSLDFYSEVTTQRIAHEAGRALPWLLAPLFALLLITGGFIFATLFSYGLALPVFLFFGWMLLALWNVRSSILELQLYPNAEILTRLIKRIATLFCGIAIMTILMTLAQIAGIVMAMLQGERW